MSYHLHRQNSNGSFVVGFEGNIGVGKSTLCSKLVSFVRHPDECIVYKENVNEQFLKLFYGNPTKYGFAFQIAMLYMRMYQKKLAERDSSVLYTFPISFAHSGHSSLSSSSTDEYISGPEGTSLKVSLWDRTTIGDYIFALWNFMLGSISNEELLVYESIVKEPNVSITGTAQILIDIADSSHVHMYILLDDEPEECKKRVELMRQNESESNIPLSYYEGIDDIHFSIFVQNIIPKSETPVVVLPWASYNDESKIWKNISTTINFDNSTTSEFKLAQVKFANQAEQTPNSVIYNTRKDIITRYNQLKEFANRAEFWRLQGLASFGNWIVYVNSNMMLINPEKKNVHNKLSWVKFYENEYKRVVMSHLSQGHLVYFYENK